LQARDLLMQHLDALGALGRWSEIKELLESDRYPLERVVQYMYLARCNAQLGEKTSAEIMETRPRSGRRRRRQIINAGRLRREKRQRHRGAIGFRNCRVGIAEAATGASRAVAPGAGESRHEQDSRRARRHAAALAERFRRAE